MQLRRLILKYKFAAGDLTGKKVFEWWKVVVTGLMLTAAALLLASLILSTASMGKNPSQDSNTTYKISSVYRDDNWDGKHLSNISRMVLPMAQVYCSIQSCVVTCSRIPAASNPGIVAAVFLDSDYESRCPDHVLVDELVFENCRFSDNSLGSRWFPSRLQLRKLTLRYCSLTTISADAFSIEPFEVLKSLAIIDNGISVFKKSLFDVLPNLEELVITNNAIDYAEADLLAGTANALQILQMDNAITSEDALINITGKSSLSRVLLLSLTGNFLPNISASFFKGVPNVQSVYLTNSAISSIQPRAFRPFSGSLRQLFLAGNKLSSLPTGLFQAVLKANPKFKLTLDNNDWNCSCELQWLKNLINKYQILNDEPRCATPDWNAGLTFSEATFCGSETSTRSNESAEVTTESIDTDDPATPLDMITLMCPLEEEFPKSSSRKLLAMQEFKFRSRSASFSVQEMENGSVYISLTTVRSLHTLVWFINDVDDLGDINCIANVKKSLYLDDLTPGGLYTICLLNRYGDLTSPFNCISLHKQTTNYQSLWLTNEDKPIIFCGITAALIFVCLGSVVGSYYVVRKNPRLLKGSKRIIMVRHRAADAIVLPEGIRLESSIRNSAGPAKETCFSGPKSQKDYVTPLSKRKEHLARKSSVVSGTSSRSSANSYVSGIEPTTMQLMSWRFGRIRENFSCHNRSESDDSPPPLPPPRDQSIPSLSLNVERKTSTPNDLNMVSIFGQSDEENVDLNGVSDEQRL